MRRVRLRSAGFMAAVTACASASAVTPALPSYSITVIAVPANALSVQPNAINTSGQVTGAISFPSQASHAFLYTKGVLSDLGTLTYPGTSLQGAAAGQAINDAGDVAGTFTDPVSQSWSFGFTYQNAVITALFGLTGYTNCTATGINKADLIVGTCSGSTGSVASFAATYSNGTPGQIGPDNGSASAVNIYGQVAGVGPATGFIYNSSGTLTTIPSLSSSTSPAPAASPSSINNAGQAVGWQASGSQFAAFLYATGATQPLSAVSNSSVQSLLSINNAGQVVGYTFVNATTTPFLLANGTATNVNSLVSPTDPNQRFVTIAQPVAINDSGSIIATGTDSRTGLTGAYLLNPTTPLPVNVTVLAAATAVTGTPFTVAWIDQSATTCTASGGSGSDGWKGTVAVNGGQQQVTESMAGTYDFTLGCQGGQGSVTSTAKVVVAAKTPAGGLGGGGSLELPTLAALLALLASVFRATPGRWARRARAT